MGGIILPQLLEQLGVKDVTILNGEPTGDFAHNPEPLKQHLGEICGLMAKGGYDIGLVCDPDVDRLVFIQEDGEMYGEEYTLVTCADWVCSTRRAIRSPIFHLRAPCVTLRANMVAHTAPLPWAKSTSL